MNKYRVSQYLNIVDMNETALLFNGINGCLDEVSRPLAENLKSNTDDFSFLSGEDIEFLAKRGHITKLDAETERARFKELTAAIHAKRAKEVFNGGIMLLMSYNCNLACKYCYQQQHRPGKSKAIMSEELLDLVLSKHLSALLPGIATKNIRLSFYGGEPFLESNEHIVRKALGYAKQYGMGANAISNATQVDKMADIFGEGPGKVNQVQVSLDGDREHHDASRIPASGEATFDTIVKNVAMLLKQKTRISLRLNLDRPKMAAIPQLIEELKKLKIADDPHASIYASPLHDNIAEVDATDFMDISELSEKTFNLGIDLEHPVSLRANDLNYLFQLEKGLGLVSTSFCMQTLQNTLVVDPFGDLYSCFEEAGYPEFRVGHISEQGVEWFPLRETYKTRHIANMPDCINCSVALACGGQCGVRCRAKTGDLFKPHCDNIKSVILEGIKLAYKRKQTLGAQAEKQQINRSETISMHA